MFLKLWDMSYRKIGDLIQLVDQRNKDLAITHLVGLTINKKFIPSVANIIGTDMGNYKLIRKNQFACSTMQVRRDKKMPIALLKEFDIAIISQAYPVFEVIDENVILPDYLMLWFSRSEFDREACFHAVGGVRGSLEWEDFCGMQLPVPSIEQQRQIVAQYQSIANKIKVNEKICEKLEATAQALYKNWFVNFEFPVVTSSGVEMPYKSSGGKMIWNEELGKEIPEGWEIGNLSDLITVKYGKDYKHLKKGKIPLYGSGGIMSYVNEILYNGPSVLIPRKGSLNNILYVKSPFWSVDTMFYSIPKLDNVLNYAFNILSKLDFNSLNVGSAVPSMTTEYLNSMSVLIPNKEVLVYFENEINRIEDYKISISTQNQKLTQLQILLLSRLAVGEEVGV